MGLHLISTVFVHNYSGSFFFTNYRMFFNSVEGIKISNVETPEVKVHRSEQPWQAWTEHVYISVRLMWLIEEAFAQQ